MIDKSRVKEKIVKVFYDKAPNCLLPEHIYNHLTDIPRAVIDDALAELISANTITTNNRESNKLEVFKDVRREPFYLVEYPKNLPYSRTTEIGSITLPRLLDQDAARAEDVNQLTEVVKGYSDNIKKQVDREVKKQIASIYSQIIVIFGIFVSVFALIVISTEKLIVFDPRLIENSDYWQLFWKSFILFIPVAIVMIVFMVFLWFITKKLKP